MAVTVGVPIESAQDENRVALVPDVVSRLKKKGLDILVEKGAGESAHYADETFESQGAALVSKKEAFSADIVVKVQPPSDEEIGMMKSGGIYVGMLNPLDNPHVSAALGKQGVTALSMELVPRISRAQKMDALSAMSSVGGYLAVLKAANVLPKFFPLLTTAAGTVKPANALILGAGVAGLQAIATARRLGARVSAYDIRDAVREEIQSLGGTFVELQIEAQDDKDSGGYAKALAEEKQKHQVELLVPHIGNADVVISTALIPGREAPLLISEDAVKAMKPGSVIIDMAAPNGGNCACTEPGKTVVKHGVTIIGPTNLPSEMAVHASQMYARTIMAMILEFHGDDGFVSDFEDDIFKGACVTHGGEVIHERVKGILAG